MSKLSKLLQVTNDEKRAILEHYEMTEDQFEENVNMLRDWLRQSEHLPQEEGENKLRLVLINCKMSLEKAKKSLEGYYTIRARYASEFFDKMIPNTEEYNQSKKLVKAVIMPNLTPDLCRVTIFKITDPEGIADDGLSYEIPVFMITEMRLTEELCLSNIIIIDFSSYSWKNLMKFTPTINQKLVDMLMSVNIRIRSVHFVNVSGFLDQVMRLVKSLLPSKMMGKINVHKSLETLWKHIPQECLPLDYGGLQKPLEKIYEDWCEQIEESEDLFNKLLSAKSTAKIELDPERQDLFGCGAEGSFRQLVLD